MRLDFELDLLTSRRKLHMYPIASSIDNVCWNDSTRLDDSKRREPPPSSLLAIHRRIYEAQTSSVRICTGGLECVHISCQATTPAIK